MAMVEMATVEMAMVEKLMVEEAMESSTANRMFKAGTQHERNDTCIFCAPARAPTSSTASWQQSWREVHLFCKKGGEQSAVTPSDALRRNGHGIEYSHCVAEAAERSSSAAKTVARLNRRSRRRRRRRRWRRGRRRRRRWRRRRRRRRRNQALPTRSSSISTMWGAAVRIYTHVHVPAQQRRRSSH